MCHVHREVLYGRVEYHLPHCLKPDVDFRFCVRPSPVKGLPLPPSSLSSRPVRGTSTPSDSSRIALVPTSPLFTTPRPSLYGRRTCLLRLLLRAYSRSRVSRDSTCGVSNLPPVNYEGTLRLFVLRGDWTDVSHTRGRPPSATD